MILLLLKNLGKYSIKVTALLVIYNNNNASPNKHPVSRPQPTLVYFQNKFFITLHSFTVFQYFWKTSQVQKSFLSVVMSQSVQLHLQSMLCNLKKVDMEAYTLWWFQGR